MIPVTQIIPDGFEVVRAILDCESVRLIMGLLVVSIDNNTAFRIEHMWHILGCPEYKMI